MRTEDAVDRLLQGIERLEGRLEKIESRLGILESRPEPPPPEPPAAKKPAPEERPDPFMPAVVRAPASKHMLSVSRALSMLGLVPEEPEESAPEQSHKYKAAMQHALDALRGTHEPQAPSPAAAPEAPAAEAPPASPVEEIAKEVATPDVPAPAPAAAAAPPPVAAPPPYAAAPAAAGGVFMGALRRAKAAAARLAGRTPEPEPAPAPPPASAPPPAAIASAVPAEASADAPVVPAPEVFVVPAPAPKAAPKKQAAPADVDLGAALQIDLEKPVTGVRDYAAPILNALVLLAAAGGALYAGGAITKGGPARDAWPEIGTGLLAVLCGAVAWFWRSGSPHLRAFLAGVSALLLNVVLLVVVPGLAFPSTLVATACGLVAFLGLRLVLETRHPLALFVGFGLALLLPHWFVVDETLRMHFVAAVNVATAVGALRLHRLQASVAAAALTAPVLYAVRGPAAVLCGGLCAGTYLSAALLAPLVLKRRSYSAAALAILAFGYAAWTVHVPYVGPGWFKAAMLFGVAAAAALVAVRLPLRHGLLRGVFKASSLLLLLAALPAGLETGTLAPSTLFLAMLFAVFALALRDAFLRAAGSLMLVVTMSLFYREGVAAPLLLAAAAAATALCAASPEGPSPRSLVLLLGASAHGLFLLGLERLLPGAWVGYAWIATAVALQGGAWRFPLVFLQAGAVIAAAAAAFRGIALVDPIAIGAAALAFGALAGIARRAVLLVPAEMLAVAALSVAWPGPTGLLFALPLLALLPLPWAWARTQGRLLAIVLLARSLAPDVLLAPGDLGTAGMAACAVAAILAARGDRRFRAVGLILATGAVGAWVRVRTGRDDWALWAAAVALAASFLAAVPLKKRETPEDEDGVELDVDVEADTDAGVEAEGVAPDEDATPAGDEADADQPSAV